MRLTIRELTKDLSIVDVDDICSCWQWILKDIKCVALITCLGDLFLIGMDDSVYWLQTDRCSLTKVAENAKEFEQLLDDPEKFDEWFLPVLVEKLIFAGKILNANQVYSYKKMPVIGGGYEIENIEPTNMGVHFAFCGQICEQIKDLPDGTKVNIKFEKKT